MPNHIVPPGIYKHINREYILVTGVVQHWETHKPMIYYRDLFGKQTRYVWSIPDIISDKDKQMTYRPTQAIFHKTDAKSLAGILDKAGSADEKGRSKNTSESNMPFGLYRSYNGEYVIVHGMATDHTTGEQMVLYHTLDASEFTAIPLYVFRGKVDKNRYPNAIQSTYFKPWKLQKGNENETAT